MNVTFVGNLVSLTIARNISLAYIIHILASTHFTDDKEMARKYAEEKRRVYPQQSRDICHCKRIAVETIDLLSDDDEANAIVAPIEVTSDNGCKAPSTESSAEIALAVSPNAQPLTAFQQITDDQISELKFHDKWVVKLHRREVHRWLNPKTAGEYNNAR